MEELPVGFLLEEREGQAVLRNERGQIVFSISAELYSRDRAVEVANQILAARTEI